MSDLMLGVAWALAKICPEATTPSEISSILWMFPKESVRDALRCLRKRGLVESMGGLWRLSGKGISAGYFRRAIESRLEQVASSMERASRRRRILSKLIESLDSSNPKGVDPERYLELRDASEVSGIPQARLRRMVEAGMVEALRLGNTLLVSRESLRDCMDFILRCLSRSELAHQLGVSPSDVDSWVERGLLSISIPRGVLGRGEPMFHADSLRRFAHLALSGEVSPKGCDRVRFWMGIKRLSEL